MESTEVEPKKPEGHTMFHWREGIYFGRMEAGSVRLIIRRDLKDEIPKVDEEGKAERNLVDRIIPPSEWCSIVAHVAKGETAFPRNEFEIATDLHG